jgi:hypothetical protein
MMSRNLYCSELDLRPSHTILRRVSPRSPAEPGAGLSFELTGNRGAALATRHPTYNEDSQVDSAFKKYTIRHYKSCVKFARDKEYGENLRPVLVSGFEMTKDFAIMAYSNNRTSVQPDETFPTPMFGSTSASNSWTWRTPCRPHLKHGPQRCRPPSPSQSRAAESPPNEFNQCVFVRYYTMRFEFGLFPRVIRAGAGPHDLGPGDNRGDTFPELTTRSSAEPMNDGQDAGEQWDPAISDPGSEDMVIRNVPYVWFFACASVSSLTFASRMKDMTVGMPSRTTCSR